MKTVFNSKVDMWLVCLVDGVMVIPAVYALFDFDPAGFIVIAVMWIFVNAVLFGIRYIVEDDTLTVKVAGIRSGRYDLKTLQFVRKTHTLISEPAASMDRIRLDFGNRKSAVISPADRESFIELLKKINPGADYNI